LTSRFGATGREIGENGVYRDLHLEMELGTARNGVLFFVSRGARERENLNRLRAAVANVAPDAILVWGMWNLHRSLPALVEELLPERVAYYMGDFWPSLPSQHKLYWESPARSLPAALVKAPLRHLAGRIMSRERQPSLALRRVMFPTAFMRDEFRRQGIHPRESAIVYGAIDTSLYAHSDERRDAARGESLRLLCVSRLTPEKGVDTAIQALARLVLDEGLTDAHLTVVGSGDRDYENHLRELVRREGVTRAVTFLGAQPPAAMPSLYETADIFLFTSRWPEPFGRVIVEAMASGLPVIGTAVGGATEILSVGENALLFEPGNAIDLAAQVRRLHDSPALRAQLTKRGRHMARQKYAIVRMTAEIEAFLERMAGGTTERSTASA
jgi:glycosyltransferase involved in cell wall biosynthesis